MADKDELEILRRARPPEQDTQAKARAVSAALAAFDAHENRHAAQGRGAGRRLMHRAMKLWSETMQKKMFATPAIGALLALPVVAYVAWQALEDSPFALDREAGSIGETAGAPATRAPSETSEAASHERETLLPAGRKASDAAAPSPAAPAAIVSADKQRFDGAAGARVASRLVAERAPKDVLRPLPSGDRLERFDTNPVHSALRVPVSTFSIDVDTASYSFVRRALRAGTLPDPDTVRVEEMINYFPYDWPGSEGAQAPFKPTVTVMPTPWNAHTKLMHIAIKGYDVQPAARPAANLVFLIDTSGSMTAEDKLPLLKNAFRLLIDRLSPDDTVSIVTYAGSAGTVLEPTRVSDKGAILSALDRLRAGGSTAGEAGIREAYRLARQSFVEDGVNRVMLATDGDFNVGQTSDVDLERLIEEKRESGVFLSVFGFGRGNLNDRLMQTLAQNGNGTAAYIDTLAEAEKTLVQESTSTLFPIARDVKIQVEFNPDRVAEYRLIGYESRALKREDFNNDRVDAGEIGSGHSVTAIYEITPTGSSARMMDDLRYGDTPDEAPPDTGSGSTADEYAFLKMRYKLPDESASRLITKPVTSTDEVATFDDAGDDARFSVAVAAFGQKLRGADQTASFGFDRIRGIAGAARGADPYGYRSEFLSLVRLAEALDDKGRR